MIKYLELTPPDDTFFRQAKIVKIHINEGDSIKKGDALFTVKKNKETQALPSTHDGKITEIIAQLNENINSMTPLVLLETTIDKKAVKKDEKYTQQTLNLEDNETTQAKNTQEDTNMTITEVKIPDIGTDAATVIEIHIQAGDTVNKDDALLTLESDKASMDLPSPIDGTIKEILVNLDQQVSEDELVFLVKANTKIEEEEETNVESNQEVEKTIKQEAPPAQKTITTAPAATQPSQKATSATEQSSSHASPSIRRFARELGVNLTQVVGSGRKKRITKEDVKQFIKGVMQSANHATPSGTGIEAIPVVDFSQFGHTELRPLNRIKQLTAKNLHRSWLNVPHVTHNDEANIDNLESFRKQLNGEYKKQGSDTKLSPLAFIVKAMVNALEKFPQFNSSLDESGTNLIYKQYINIGIAVETPDGLVVPVIKSADQKTVAQIAQEMGELAQKARNKKLTMNDMSGACITISSLGGIGGTYFTPIVNAPEVAILGVSRTKIQPVWNGSEFTPGMMLPLSLSYDHRVIDGAEAARFTRHIANLLEDIRRLTV